MENHEVTTVGVVLDIRTPPHQDDFTVVQPRLHADPVHAQRLEDETLSEHEQQTRNDHRGVRRRDAAGRGGAPWSRSPAQVPPQRQQSVNSA